MQTVVITPQIRANVFLCLSLTIDTYRNKHYQGNTEPRENNNQEVQLFLNKKADSKENVN